MVESSNLCQFSVGSETGERENKFIVDIQAIEEEEEEEEEEKGEEEFCVRFEREKKCDCHFADWIVNFFTFFLKKKVYQCVHKNTQFQLYLS